MKLVGCEWRTRNKEREMAESAIDPSVADNIACGVFHCFREALDEGRERKKLDALAYSGNSHEKWLVFETYWRVLRDWQKIVPQPAPDNWDARMEMIVPKQTRQHIDMVVGPVETWERGWWQPQASCPVFEFKVVRDVDWNDTRNSVKSDVDKMVNAGLTNAYLIILYYLLNEHEKPEWFEQELRKIAGIEICGDLNWGPYSADVKQFDSTCPYKPRFFAEAFRLVRKYSSTLLRQQSLSGPR